MTEVTGDGSDRVDFDGFLKIRHLIKKREGLAVQELDLFSQVFQHFDREKTGIICQEEFSSALAWLGFPNTLAEVHGQHKDLKLSENEFLRCLSKVHNHETALIEKFFDSRHANKQLRSGQQKLAAASSCGVRKLWQVRLAWTIMINHERV